MSWLWSPRYSLESLIFVFVAGLVLASWERWTGWWDGGIALLLIVHALGVSTQKGHAS